jgi:hypothetical protein
MTFCNAVRFAQREVLEHRASSGYPYKATGETARAKCRKMQRFVSKYGWDKYAAVGRG